MKGLSLLVTFLLICSLFPVTEAGDIAPSAILADEAWEMGLTGKGVNIAVISTGIDNEHPGLEGKFVAGYDALCSDDPLCMTSFQEDDGSFDPDDQNQQGTAVAAMATSTGLLANGEQSNFTGTAPDAKLIDVRVASAISSGSFENSLIEQEFYESAMDGISWVIENKDTAWSGAENDSYGIDIMVVPWGITSYEDGGSDGTDMFSQLLDQAMLAGIVVVVAAGNNGPDNDGLSGMGASSLSITVGAIDDKNTISKDDDGIASYSSRGPRKDNNDGNPHDELKPDVVAPGTNIVQAAACVYVEGGCNNRIPGQDASSNGYSGRGSGTGYAAAYVAGVAALLLEANPELTPSEVKEIIQNSADRKETLSSADGEGIEEGDWATYPELEPRWNRHFGYGVVNASAMVKGSIPNFFISSLEISNSNPEPDSNVTVTANIGIENSLATYSFVVSVWVGHSTGGNSTLIEHFTMDGAGVIKKEWKLNSTLGLHNVFVYVDSENSTTESNENDNVASIDFLVEEPPNILIAIAGKNLTVTEGTTVQFSGIGTVQKGNIVKYEWDFDGDGFYEWSSTETGLTTFIYNEKGDYVAGFRITDDSGNTSTDQRTITVVADTVDDSSNEEGDSSLPSLSLLLVTTMFGLVARYRRK